MGGVVRRLEVGFRNKDHHLLKDSLGIPLESLIEADIYTFSFPEGHELHDSLLAVLSRQAPLADPIVQAAVFDTPLCRRHGLEWDWMIEYGLRPGTQDPVGDTAMETLTKILPSLPLGTRAYASRQLIIKGAELSRKDIERLAQQVANPEVFISTIIPYHDLESMKHPLPEFSMDDPPRVVSYHLAAMTDDELSVLNKELCLAATLEELRYVGDHFKDEDFVRKRKEVGLDGRITDVEIGLLFGIKSEHCDHKEFKADIYLSAPRWKEDPALRRYVEEGIFPPAPDMDDTFIIPGMFSTFIREPLSIVRGRLAKRGLDWVVKALDDNAGTVRIGESKTGGDLLLCYKCETHNSPIRQNPMQGAKTGKDGVDRDDAGNGRAGFDLMAGFFFYCMGDPQLAEAGIPETLSPLQEFTGCVQGVKEAGNESQVPTGLGGMIVDPRFIPSPLIYCGTWAVMPALTKGISSVEKRIEEGDIFCVVGGRVGLDGIHGGTTSSLERTLKTAPGHVQIDGSFTQNKVNCFLSFLAHEGEIHAIQDFGAVGLGSSYGELAERHGGGVLDLEKHPVKYAGLQPKQIIISESQNRMGIVIPKEAYGRIREIADLHEVEMTAVGEFVRSGYLTIRHEGTVVGLLDVDFLRQGLPKKKLIARWDPPEDLEEHLHLSYLDSSYLHSSHPHSSAGQTSHGHHLLDSLQRVLAHPDITSKEWVFRKKDSSVKGQTIVGPMAGKHAIDSDVSVMRSRMSANQDAVVFAYGIEPKMSDIDAYAAEQVAFTDMVGKAVASGALLPDLSRARLDSWDVCDNFCLPNSAYDPIKNPLGDINCGKMVRLGMGLRDSILSLNIPAESGKDSMKNSLFLEVTGLSDEDVPPSLRPFTQFIHDDGKTYIQIHIPPTLLMSGLAYVPRYDAIVGQAFKRPGDLIYVLGSTRNEFGGTEIAELEGIRARPPIVRSDDFELHGRRMEELLSEGMLSSSCYVHKGGLGTALFRSAAMGDLGVWLDVARVPTFGALSAEELLYSRTPGRYLISFDNHKRREVDKILQGTDHAWIGTVQEGVFTLETPHGKESVTMDALIAAYKAPLSFDLPDKRDYPV